MTESLMKRVVEDFWRRIMKIVEKADLKEFTIFGDIPGGIPFSSKKMTFLLAHIPPRGIVPEHSHPHEQMGICLKGKAEFRTGEEKKTVGEGMFYWIEPGEKHSVVSLVDEPSLFLDVFSPPREEYVEKAKKAEQR